MKTIKEIEEIYDLELDRILRKIKEENAKFVLVQFPDGLKPFAISIVDYLEEHTRGVEFAIWLGSCYGACDYPVGIDNLRPKIDLVIQFGHNSLMPNY